MALEFLYSKKLYIDPYFYNTLKKYSPGSNLDNLDIIKKIEKTDYYDLSHESMTLYEKTFILYIVKYVKDPIMIYTSMDWENLSTFYGIKFNIIKPLVDENFIIHFRYIVFDKEIVDININSFEIVVIDDLFRYMQILESLDIISINQCESSLKDNKYIYHNVCDLISLLNMDIMTRKSMNIGYFDKNLIPQTQALDNICAMHKIINLIEISSFEENRYIIENLYRSYNNYIEIHADMLYLMLTLQVIELSPFVSNNLIETIEKIFDIFIPLFKDAKILSILTNKRSLNENKNYSVRGSADQTTRLQIIYEYNNMDQYNLRLDFPHKGVPSFHINNESKGQIEYFPLNQDLYKEALSINSDYEYWFISYNNKKLYFLREKYRTEVNKKNTKHKELKQLLKSTQHFTVPEFESEKNMINIFEFWLEFFNNVGKEMPKGKFDPKYMYIERFLYEFTEEYFHCKTLKDNFNNHQFQTKLLNFLCNSGLICYSEKNSLMDYTINDIIGYAHEKLKEML